jgi:hypothetical protein
MKKQTRPTSDAAAERAFSRDPAPFQGGDVPSRLRTEDAARRAQREAARRRALASITGRRTW